MRRFEMMIWIILAAISMCVVNVIAGRAYSRRLDRLEARADPVQQFLIGSPLTIKQPFDNEMRDRAASRSRAPKSDENFKVT
jgi:hypothetical protein